MSKVLVVGGGAAGMFAAIFAAYNGNEVHIFEKNEKLGKSLDKLEAKFGRNIVTTGFTGKVDYKQDFISK